MRRADLSHAVRETLERFPPPHDHAYGVVPAPPPETGVVLTSMARRHDAALEALARVEEYAHTLKDPYVVNRILLRQEAVSSSAIEGTQSTLDELLAEEETRDESARAEVRQVRQYARAVDDYVVRARTEGPKVFSLKVVGNLHRRIMSYDPAYPDPPGKVRDRTVWIGGRDIAYSTFNPPPATRVAACLEQTLAYMRAEGLHSQQQSLLTRMAIAHAHFEAVHPYRDGNGRVGRMLLPMMMAAEGRTPLYLAAYIEANKPAYYAALKAAQQQLDWPEMVGFLADAVVGSTEELMRTRAALQAVETIWAGRRAFRQGSSSLRTLTLLPHYPVITISRLTRLLGVTFAAAATAVRQLQDIGVLSERTGHNRNRVYVATEALALLNRPFGEEPILPDA